MDTYLNDHIAGATAGRNLAKMAPQEHQTDEHGPFFSEIYAATDADYATLQRLAGALGVDDLLSPATEQREKIEAQRQKMAPGALRHTVPA